MSHLLIQKTRDVYHQPLVSLLSQAMVVHRQNHDPLKVELCTLSNIKSGRCSEDCGYCPQSAHHQTQIEEYPLLDKDTVLEQARQALANGSTRLCMGGAWPTMPTGTDFDRVAEIVSAVKALGLETCGTFGMMTKEQACHLKQAGLDVYNHNLDTSPEFYPNIVTTHSFQQRLETISHVRQAGIKVCCGGILGMGESANDRIALVAVLAGLNPPPDYVPINWLVKIEGTPLAHASGLDWSEFVRTIATARVMMPHSRIRLAAGRLEMSQELQLLCFLAGANSIFSGAKLLTSPNPDLANDLELLQKFGLQPQAWE